MKGMEGTRNPAESASPGLATGVFDPIFAA